jgi:hypothetical protein
MSSHAVPTTCTHSSNPRPPSRQVPTLIDISLPMPENAAIFPSVCMAQLTFRLRICDFSANEAVFGLLDSTRPCPVLFLYVTPVNLPAGHTLSEKCIRPIFHAHSTKWTYSTSRIFTQAQYFIFATPVLASLPVLFKDHVIWTSQAATFINIECIFMDRRLNAAATRSSITTHIRTVLFAPQYNL